MDLSQLKESVDLARLKGDVAGTVAKAVSYANACQQVRKYDSAIACLNKSLPDIEKDKGQHAVVRVALGVAFWEKSQLKKALSHFEEALPLFEKDKAGKAAILSIVGITFWRKCEWDKALEILKDALDQKEGKAEKDARFESLYGAFDRGIVTLQNRIRLGRELQKPMKILQPLFSLTALYLITGNREELKSCLDESVTLATQLNQEDILKAAERIKQL